MSTSFCEAQCNFLILHMIARESREAITTMRDFGKKCLKEMPKQGNSVAAFGFNKVIRKTCKDQESRKELYENLSCFNPVATAMRKQLDLFRLDMVRATFLQDNSLKIVAACCTYFNRSTALTNTGRKVCDQRKTEYLDSFMRGFAGDILDLICFGMTPESQKCRSLVLPPVEVTNRVPYVESFVPALLELMSSM